MFAATSDCEALHHVVHVRLAGATIREDHCCQRVRGNLRSIRVLFDQGDEDSNRLLGVNIEVLQRLVGRPVEMLASRHKVRGYGQVFWGHLRALDRTH